MKRMATVVAVMMTLSCISGFASFITGNDLMQSALEYEKGDNEAIPQDQVNWMEVGNFMGFVYGVYDAQEGILFAPADNLSGKQLFDLVIRFLKAAPGRRHEPAARLVLAALQAAFPKKG